MRNNKIQELITQLNLLQSQQAELFTLLERAIDTKAARREEKNVTNNEEYHRENVANDTKAAGREEENVTNNEEYHRENVAKDEDRQLRRAQKRENVTNDEEYHRENVSNDEDR
jgi:hypothetical protein